MKVTLYSTHCPNCTVLEKKLKLKNIDFNEVNDIKIMEDKGFVSAPMLEVDDKIMNFQTAIEWIKTINN